MRHLIGHRRFLSLTLGIITMLLTVTLPATGARADGCASGGTRPAPILHQGPKGAPLIIALHAAGGTPSGFEQTSGWNNEPASVVYPGSPGNEWCPADMPTNMAYLQQEIPYWTSRLNADPNRVVATGFSAGGAMAAYLACNDSGQVAYAALVSASYNWKFPACRISRQESELQIFGSQDIVPLQPTSTGALSYQQMFSLFAGADGCDPGPVANTRSIASETSVPCPNHVAVSDVELAGGTHQYPGAPQSTGADALWSATPFIWRWITDQQRMTP